MAFWLFALILTARGTAVPTRRMTSTRPGRTSFAMVAVICAAYAAAALATLLESKTTSRWLAISDAFVQACRRSTDDDGG